MLRAGVETGVDIVVAQVPAGARLNRFAAANAEGKAAEDERGWATAVA